MALTQVSTNGIADGAVTANDLENSGVTAGTYGSSSAIPAITVDAKGRVTSATTNSVTQVGGANGVDFNDSVKAQFGTGNDLQIYHNGTNSVIYNTTGKVLIENHSDDKDIELKTDNGSGATATYILCDGSSGAVNLNYYGSNKLATTSTGINVTGTVICDGITIDGSATIAANEGILTIKDNNSTGDSTVCYIRGDDSAGNRKWFVGDLGNSNADVYLSNDQSGPLIFRTGSTERCFINSNGHLVPYLNNTYDLGENTRRWSNVYADTLYGNGSNLTNTGGLKSVQVFTSSGTWTKPAGINRIKVIVTGGGGGGGNGTASDNTGQGGGAGGTAIEVIDVSAVSSVSVTVGGGGAASTSSTQNNAAANGGSGGTSSFGSYCSASGGEGGDEGWGQAEDRGKGGVGSGGNINLSGGHAASNGGGDSSDQATGSIGGASYWGGGGKGGDRGDNGSRPGKAGAAYGSGGGGGGCNGSTTYAGAAGKAGVVYIEEYA